MAWHEIGRVQPGLLRVMLMADDQEEAVVLFVTVVWF